MAYKCRGCGRTFEKLENNKFRCPMCGYRIIEKTRPEIVRVVRDRKIKAGMLPV